MTQRKIVSDQTRRNWLLDAVLLISAVFVAASSAYFLYFPSAGYQGGRNPGYNAVVLFNRDTWDIIHTWMGIAMILVALVHFLVHWNWVNSMAKRVWRELTAKSSIMNAYGRFNVAVDIIIAVGFFLAAISGVYFLVVGGSHGGTNPDPMIIFSRTTWDVIHTWSGVAMIIAAIVHFAIHWRWVMKVTGKVFSGLFAEKTSGPSQPAVDQPAV